MTYSARAEATYLKDNVYNPGPKSIAKKWATKSWVQCNEWLKQVIRMGSDAPAKRMAKSGARMG